MELQLILIDVHKPIIFQSFSLLETRLIYYRQYFEIIKKSFWLIVALGSW